MAEIPTTLSREARKQAVILDGVCIDCSKGFFRRIKTGDENYLHNCEFPNECACAGKHHALTGG